MHVTHPPRPAIPAWTPAVRPAAPAGSLWPAWLEVVLARAKERRQLQALGARDLRDIGLTPAEAWALTRKPLWRR